MDAGWNHPPPFRRMAVLPEFRGATAVLPPRGALQMGRLLHGGTLAHPQEVSQCPPGHGRSPLGSMGDRRCCDFLLRTRLPERNARWRVGGVPRLECVGIHHQTIQATPTHINEDREARDWQYGQV